MWTRRTLAAGAALLMALGLAAPVAADGKPTVATWSNPVDVPYFDCGTFTAHGVWTVSHVLTTWFHADGTPDRDIEQVSFSGAFVNTETGASIADSGRIIFFDTLAPDFSYLSTDSNVVRHSAYFRVAGRSTASGAFHGVDRFDVNIPAACAALGA